jgi:hypothetical protein
MDGEWIKMRTDLSEDPIVLAIAARLGVDEFSVVGRLHRIWSWADRHLVDGVALGITMDWIDQYVRLEGFSISLLEVGWLTKIEKGALLDSRKTLLDSFSNTFLDSSRFLLEGGDLGGVVFPRFFNYLQGKTLTTNTKTNPTPTRESEIEKAPRKKIEKEPSRIEKEESFSIFWKAYPRKDSKVPAQKAFEKVCNTDEQLQVLLQAIEKFKRCEQWTRDGGKFIPFASTWLNQHRWEDDPAPASAQRPNFQTRSYHDERADTIAGLTGRSRNHEHDDERTIDVPATAVARLAG